MGLSELVLKVPASEMAVTSRPPLQQTQHEGTSTSPVPTTRNIANRAPTISVPGSSPPSGGNSSSLPKNIPHNPPHLPPKSKMKKQCSKTHSRESSGASNLSVRFTVNDETVRQVQTRNIGSSNEDLTLSDRLSQDLDEELLDDNDDDEADDGFHPGSSKSCESIPHDRLTPYADQDGGMR